MNDPDPVHDGTRIDWHQHDAAQQAIVSVDGGEVRIAVALPEEVPRSVLDAVLSELERELDHYCGADGPIRLVHG